MDGKEYKAREEFTVDTPMGTIVVYASIDPLNPGVFIDLRREGYGFDLNLACIECNLNEDTNEPEALMCHVWADGTKEDTTHDISFSNTDEYFTGRQEGGN